MCLPPNNVSNCSWLRKDSSTTRPEKLEVPKTSTNYIKHCPKMLRDEEEQRWRLGRHVLEGTRGIYVASGSREFPAYPKE